MIDFFKEKETIEGYTIQQKILYGSVGLSLLVMISGFGIFVSISDELGLTMMMLGMMIGVLPYGIMSFFKNRAVREVENQFPSFLKDLAESKRGGMTIIKAFDSARSTDYGRLNNEIEKVHNQLTWGVPFPEVMKRFSNRMESSTVIQQSLSIIIQSFESGGNVTDTIQSVAEDASKLKSLLQEKDSKLKQQLFIIYIIYFLFVGITIGTYFMMGELLGLGTSEEGAIEGMQDIITDEDESMTRFCGEDIVMASPFCSLALVFNFVPDNVSELGYDDPWVQEYGYAQMGYYKSLLFSMLIVQGISIAALAGQIREGTPSAGVKHGLIMLPVAFIAFMLVVGPAGVI